jgi:hypothetical protein
MDYFINPVYMGGLVREISDGMVKIHLHGRLGVLCVPQKIIQTETTLMPGDALSFYFSYVEVVKEPYDYDSAALNQKDEIAPCLLGAKITEVNDTAIKAEIMDGLGTIAVPLRWVFTPVALEVGQDVEFYLSCMKVTGKRDCPVRQ